MRIGYGVRRTAGDVAEEAAWARDLGLDALSTSEVAHDPFLGCGDQRIEQSDGQTVPTLCAPHPGQHAAAPDRPEPTCRGRLLG